MTITQLRALVCVVECNFHVSQAAERLHTVQSAVSRQLAQLEEQLGVPMFERRGKRLLRLTSAGKDIVLEARALLRSEANIEKLGSAWRDSEQGVLRIATTHTQAKYLLPSVVERLRHKFPRVKLRMIQGSPQELIRKIDLGQADLAICTEVIPETTWLESRALTKWTHAVVLPRSHKLARRGQVTSQDLLQYPLITYDFGFTGRKNMQEFFQQKGLELEPILTAIDTDIIKTYVRAGLGLGIIAEIAFTPKQDMDLKIMRIADYDRSFVTRVAWHRDAYLPSFTQEAVALMSAHGAELTQRLPSRIYGET